MKPTKGLRARESGGGPPARPKALGPPRNSPRGKGPGLLGSPGRGRGPRRSGGRDDSSRRTNGGRGSPGEPESLRGRHSEGRRPEPRGPPPNSPRPEVKTRVVTEREMTVQTRAPTMWTGTLRRSRPRSRGKRRASQKMSGVSATQGIQLTADTPRASDHSIGLTSTSRAANANVRAAQTAAWNAKRASGRRARLGEKSDTDIGGGVNSDGAGTRGVKPGGGARSRRGLDREAEQGRGREEKGNGANGRRGVREEVHGRRVVVTHT